MVQGEFFRSLLSQKFPALCSIINFKIDVFKIDIVQTKAGGSSCHAEAFWQNQRVVNTNYNCLTGQTMFGLYVAGTGYQIVNGQVRNFSYVKK